MLTDVVASATTENTDCLTAAESSTRAGVCLGGAISKSITARQIYQHLMHNAAPSHSLHSRREWRWVCSEALMQAARSCGLWRPSTHQLPRLQLHGLMLSARTSQALPMLAIRRCTMVSAADLQLLQGKQTHVQPLVDLSAGSVCPTHRPPKCKQHAGA